MFWRGGLVVLSVAAVIGSRLLAQEPAADESTPPRPAISVALAEGRTDDQLLVAASQGVEDAARHDDLRAQGAALELLGQVYSARGEYADAQRVEERALAVWSGLDDSDSTARVLERLADAQIQSDAFDAARDTVRRLRAIRERARGLQPIDFARVLELEATLRSRAADYAGARQILDEAFAIVDPATLPDDRIASLRYVSGDLAYFMGDIQRAAMEYDAALAAARRTFGARHPALVRYLGRAANARSAFGDLDGARALRADALEIAKTRLPQCHPLSIGTLNNLAISEHYFGNYAEARELFATALARAQRCLGANHSQTATFLGNLGAALMDLGDIREAERTLRAAVAAWTANRGPDHPFVALALENLAEVLVAEGRFDEAMTLYQRTLSIRTGMVGENHPTVGRLLTLRAKALAQQRKFTAALRDVDRADEIYKRQPAVDEPDTVARTDVQLLRGTIERNLGHLAQARRAFADVLAARESLFGPSHPLVADARTLVASMDLAAGSPADAFAEALRAEAASREHVRQTIRYLTERQALEFVARRPPALDLAVSVAAGGDAGTRRAALDAVVRSRAVVLDELAERARLAHSDPASTPDVVARFVSARQRHANLLVQSLRELVPRERIAAARAEAEEAEARLAEQNAATRIERATAGAGLDQVLAALPADAALVAFVRYSASNVGASRPSGPKYGAFVVSADAARTITFIDLGPGPVVDRLVRAWRDEVTRPPVGPTPSPLATGTALRRVAWDPIAARIGAAARVFVVTDGALSLVSFSALPRAGGGYLVEGGQVLHYLSTERDLIAATEPQSSASALIVGGPVFAGQAARANASSLRAVDCRNGRPLAFSELPGARVEAAAISSLLERSGSRDFVVLSGRAATESAVKAAFGGRRIVHLATHGFFIGSRCEPATSRTRAVGGIVAAGAPPAAILRNPLQLSGLAFAGANTRRPASDDDGILTAEEIASLNLHGTEWAVLSACNTALGEIRSGEGVLGLRRAFQIAGARTVIMSLWSVDDQATRRWMQALYEARLARRLDTADAVRSASLAVLAQRRAAHLSTHPFYWAAFVAAGDWR